MAAFGFSSSRANILVGGIDTWLVGAYGDTAVKSLGKLADGRITVNLLTQKNTFGRSVPYGVAYNVTAKMLNTHKTSVLPYLDNLNTEQLYHDIKTIGGKYLYGEFGTSWRFDSSRDYDGYRYIELSANFHTVIADASATDLDNVISSSPNLGVTAGSPGDELYAFDATLEAGHLPAGCSNFQIRNAGETSWETLGLFRNARVVAESLTTPDNLGRSVIYGVRFSVEAEMMQADEELNLLDSVATGSPDFKVTMADGAIFTLADNCGVSWEYHNETDSDGIPFIRMVGDGVFTPAAFVALIS